MRTFFFIPLLLLGIGFLQENGRRPTVTPVRGEIVATVSIVGPGGEFSAGHQVDILETGESRLTDANGMARFTVRPGPYTVRVHGLNQGGPPLPWIDFAVQVPARQTVQVGTWTCPACL